MCLFTFLIHKPKSLSGFSQQKTLFCSTWKRGICTPTQESAHTPPGPHTSARPPCTLMRSPRSVSIDSLYWQELTHSPAKNYLFAVFKTFDQRKEMTVLVSFGHFERQERRRHKSSKLLQKVIQNMNTAVQILPRACDWLLCSACLQPSELRIDAAS